MKKLMFSLTLVALCGCFQIEDELAIEPQGSGTVTITVKANLLEGMEELVGMAGSEMGGGAYPPISESAARRLFPAKDFTLKTERKDCGGTNVLIIHAAFTDINALLASPYAAAHQLHLQTNNGTLVLRAITGMSAAAQAAFTEDKETLGFLPVDTGTFKTNRTQFRFEFRVRMPAPVAQANGEKSGNAVSWTMARAQVQSDEEFMRKLATTMELSCPAQSIQFVPRSPVRLALSTFHQLKEQKSAAAAAAPDPQKVLAAAKVIPYRIRVSRMLDLSGEGGIYGSDTELLLGVVLPEEFAPQSWGKLILHEVIDASGRSLKPKEDDQDGMAFGGRSLSRFSMDEEDDQASDAPNEVKEPAPTILSASFRAPEWKVKRIAKIRGKVNLSYEGDTEIVKLTNAVPANLIVKGQNSQFMFNERERGAIQHTILQEHGMSLRVDMAMEQGNFTHLMMTVEGGKASVLAAQAFDSEGTPVPTSIIDPKYGGNEDGQQSLGVMISGKPKPPLSLALEIGAPGGIVSLPVQFDNLPLSAQ